MRHRNWLTAVLRIFGIVLVAYHVDYPLQMLMWLLSAFIGNAEPELVNRSMITDIWTAAGSFRFFFGLYLIFGGKWLINLCMRDIVGRCPGCGYDIASLSAEVCPECGIAIPPAARPVQAPPAPDASSHDDQAANR